MITLFDEKSRNDSGFDRNSTADAVDTLTMDSRNTAVRSYSEDQIQLVREKQNVVYLLMSLKNNVVLPVNTDVFLDDRSTTEQCLQKTLGSRLGSDMPLRMLSNMISGARKTAKCKELSWFSFIGILNKEDELQIQHLLEQQPVNHVQEGFVSETVMQDTCHDDTHILDSDLPQIEVNNGTSLPEIAFDSTSPVHDSRYMPLYYRARYRGTEQELSQWSTIRLPIDKAPVDIQTAKPQNARGATEKQLYDPNKVGCAYFSGSCPSYSPSDSPFTVTTVTTALTTDRFTGTQHVLQTDFFPSTECPSSVVGMTVSTQITRLENQVQRTLGTDPILCQAQRWRFQSVPHNSQNLYSVDIHPSQVNRVSKPPLSGSLDHSCTFQGVCHMLYYTVVPISPRNIPNYPGYCSMIDWQQLPGLGTWDASVQVGLDYIWHPRTPNSLTSSRSKKTVTCDSNLKSDTVTTEVRVYKDQKPAEITLLPASCNEGTRNFNTNRTPSENQQVTSSVSTVELQSSYVSDFRNSPLQNFGMTTVRNKADEFISGSSKNSMQSKERFNRPKLNTGRDKVGPLASRKRPSKYTPSQWPMTRSHQSARPGSQEASSRISWNSPSTATQPPYSQNGAQLSESGEPSVNTGGIFSHLDTTPRPLRRHWPSSRPKKPKDLPETKLPLSSDTFSHVGESSYTVENTNQYLQNVIQLLSESTDSIPLSSELDSTSDMIPSPQFPSTAADKERKWDEKQRLNEQPEHRIALTEDARSTKQLIFALLCPCPSDDIGAECCSAARRLGSQGTKPGHQVDDRQVEYQATKWEANYPQSLVGGLPPPELPKIRSHANVSLNKNEYSEVVSTPTQHEPRSGGHEYPMSAEEKSSGKLRNLLLTFSMGVTAQNRSVSVAKAIKGDSKVSSFTSAKFPCANLFIQTPMNGENLKGGYLGISSEQVIVGPEYSLFPNTKFPMAFNLDSLRLPEALWKIAADEKASGGTVEMRSSKITIDCSSSVVHPTEQSSLTTSNLGNHLSSQPTTRVATIGPLPSHPRENDLADLTKKVHEKTCNFRVPLSHPKGNIDQFDFEQKPQGRAEHPTSLPKNEPNIPSGSLLAPRVLTELSVHEGSQRKNKVRVEKPLLNEVVELVSTESITAEHPTLGLDGAGSLPKQRRTDNVLSDLPTDLLSSPHNHLIKSSSGCLEGEPVPRVSDDEDAMRLLSAQSNTGIPPAKELPLVGQQVCGRLNICHTDSRSMIASENNDHPNQSISSCAITRSIISADARRSNSWDKKRDNVGRK